MIRFLDILFSLTGLIFFSPFFLILTVLIPLDSPGGIFYLQIRVGKNGQDFRLFKFRTMQINAEKRGGLTIGARDSRITKIGFFLRRYKLDELPQLINVLKGDMSIVGPRPELRKYTDLYTENQKLVLTVKPGITDHASIEYIDENTILGHASDPEYTYIHEIMPAKIALNMKFIQNKTTSEYLKICVLTLIKVFR